MLPVSELHFDPLNPRLPTTIDRGNEVDVLEWMIDKATLTELIGSIAEQGYFPGEPLLGVKRPGGGYVIIEGNRRLAAVKLLNNPKLAKIRPNAILQASADAKYTPKELPVMLYNTRKEILDNLGFRHVTGIKTWSTLAKARFLDQMRSTFSADMDEKEMARALAKSIGSRTDYVAGLLTGLGVFNAIEQQAFFGIRGMDDDKIELSLLTTALGYKNIYSYIGLSSGRSMDLAPLKMDKVRDLTKWIFDKSEGKTRVGESRNFGDLNVILDPENPLALEAFQSGRPLEEALLLTGAPTENFRIALSQAEARLGDAQRSLKDDLALTKIDVESIKRIRRLAISLLKDVESRVDGDDEDEDI